MLLEIGFPAVGAIHELPLLLETPSPKNYPRLIQALSERSRTNIRRGLAGLLTGTWLLRETLAKQERI
jgi:hypothetical protein